MLAVKFENCCVIIFHLLIQVNLFLRTVLGAYNARCMLFIMEITKWSKQILGGEILSVFFFPVSETVFTSFKQM